MLGLTARSLRILAAVSAAVLCACADPTAPRPAVFVLRSMADVPVPATLSLPGGSYTIIADTLLVPGPSGATAYSRLARQLSAAYAPDSPALVKSFHSYYWEGDHVAVIFDCEYQRPCLSIFGYRHGSLRGDVLVFPGLGPWSPPRTYVRLR